MATRNAAASGHVIAVVFDFDDTLTDDSTTKFLQSKGVDTEHFWRKCVDAKVADGYDPSVAFLAEFLDRVGPGRPLGPITNADLREFGRTLEFYQGIPALFGRLRAKVAEHTLTHPSIEFFVISGGLEEIIRGSTIAEEFTGIWGCTLAESEGRVSRIKNVVSYTDKTRFLFGINKGVHNKMRSEAYAVNTAVEVPKRRIPWENIIYIGDGLTDIPCFSLLKTMGGKGFGVFHPERAGSSKAAWERLVAPARTISTNAAQYGENDALGAFLETAVVSICVNLDLGERLA